MGEPMMLRPMQPQRKGDMETRTDSGTDGGAGRRSEPKVSVQGLARVCREAAVRSRHRRLACRP